MFGEVDWAARLLPDVHLWEIRARAQLRPLYQKSHRRVYDARLSAQERDSFRRRSSADVRLFTPNGHGTAPPGLTGSSIRVPLLPLLGFPPRSSAGNPPPPTAFVLCPKIPWT